MTELAVPTSGSLLLNVATGELLPATVENAATVLEVAREIEANLRAVKAAATAWLVEEAMRQGTKTFHVGQKKIELTGGNVVEYDADDLVEALRAAGCPEARIAEAVEETVSYKVNRSVLRQLVGANPAYKAAAESTQHVVNKPIRASVK
jgi:maltooligosyltrehalose synthase